MLRFDNNKQPQPRNYLARREQSRLLLMIAALGLVAMLAWQVRAPRSRAALAVFFGADAAAAQANDDALAPMPDAQPSDSAAPIGSAAPLEEARQWLNPTQLESIRDNAVFRAAEADAWFAVLGQLKEMDQGPAPSAATPVGYAQLARQPHAYRGRTVLVQGTIQRVEQQTPGENDLAIDRLYRVIFRPEGDEVWPIAVYTLEPPDGIPLGEPVDRLASAVGVFFKNQSYQSQAGAGAMPVVLAKRVTLTPIPAKAKPTPAEPMDRWQLGWLAAAAAVAAAVVVLLIARQSRR